MSKGRAAFMAMTMLAAGAGIDFSDGRCPTCGYKLLASGRCLTCEHTRPAEEVKPLPPAPTKDALARAREMGRAAGRKGGKR
jgi:hypothetical protein